MIAMLRVRCLLLVLALDAGVAHAQARLLRIPSRILGEERSVHVALPSNYANARQRYQVTYLLDGHVRAFFDLAVAAAGYDVAGDIRDYGIPAQIVVGVEQKDRGADLGRNQELFSRFLHEELIPRIEREYRTVPFRTLIGHSLGGRFALNELCRGRGAFRAVIAMSPGVGDSASFASLTDCLQRSFRESGLVAQQVVLIAGEREPRSLSGAMRLQDYLNRAAPESWRISMLDGARLGHTETPFVAIPRGIRLVHDARLWEMPPATADSLLTGSADPQAIMTAWYATLSARVGYEVPAASKWLRAVASRFLAQHDLAAAETAARRAIAAYPEELSGYAILADVYLASNNGAGARRVLEDGLRMLDRLEVFDESARNLTRAALRGSLEKLAPR